MVILIKIFMVDGVSGIRIRSLAKERQFRCRSLVMLTPMDSGTMSSSSSKMRLKRIGLSGSPCLTPYDQIYGLQNWILPKLATQL